MGRAEILNPMQLLWINLITDIFPGLALALILVFDLLTVKYGVRPTELIPARRDHLDAFDLVRACPLIPVIVVSNEPESSASEEMLV